MINDDEFEIDENKSFLFTQKVLDSASGLPTGEILIALSYCIAKILIQTAPNHARAMKAAETVSPTVQQAITSLTSDDEEWDKKLQ